MNSNNHAVLGIGNAIVDVIARHDEGFLKENGLIKGSMQLVDEDGATLLYSKLGPATEISGGSAANTMAGIASLGGNASYIGKVAADQLGDVFAHDIRAAGVNYDVAPLIDGPQTARCIIVVTPDGERTMSTFLGASALLGPDDIVAEQLGLYNVVYLEGYLWDQPAAKAAFKKAATVAKSAGRTVALTLSDASCVERHRSSFRELIRADIDLLFANEAEITCLYDGAALDEAVQAVREDCDLAVVTRSEKGCVVVSSGDVQHVAVRKVEEVTDTTGAGDLFAAGFLFGHSRGLAAAECARIGNRCAGSIITQTGARPQAPLRSLL